MLTSKDVYGHITMFADERTTLNMLSVNKKFLNEEYYERVVERKYPELLMYKGKDIKTFRKREIVYLNYTLTWRNFYIKNIYYISEINRVYEIPYFNSKKYLPERIFYYMNDRRKPHEWIFQRALNEGNTEIIDLMIGKNFADFSSSSLTSVVKSGNLNLIKRIYDYRIHKDLKYPIFYAIRKNRKDIVDFLLKDETVSINWNYILLRICKSSGIDNIKYVIEKGANDISVCIAIINDELIKLKMYGNMAGYEKYASELNITLRYLISL